MNNPVLELIRDSGEAFIILCGIAVLALMIYNTYKLSGKRDRIKELLGRRNRIYRKNAETRDIEEEDDTDSSVTPDTIREHETEFNKLCSVHDLLSQLIPIFPLLGILGTVAGLILGLQNKDTMDSAMGLAMNTTFWGLVCAIILKSADAFGPSRIISDTEVMLDDFYRKIDLAEMFEKSRGAK